MLGALLLLGVLPVALLAHAHRLAHAGPSGAQQRLHRGGGPGRGRGRHGPVVSGLVGHHAQPHPAALPDQPAHLFYAIATLGEQPIQRNGAAVLPLGQDAHLAPLPPASVRRWCCWWWAKPRAPTTSA
jgi:hypothetical protein